MKKTFIIILVVLSALSVASTCGQKVPQKVKLKNFNDSASYCIGMIMAENLHKSGEIDFIDTDIFYTAMRHALDSGELQISKEQIQKIMQKYSNMVRKVKQEKWKAGEEKRKHEAEENMDKGITFLEENKSKEGVITTETGLQYKIITKGNGIKPKAADKVKVHYHGTLIDGTVFDSSVDKGAPAEFVANRVIPGWQEALQLMPVGSKWKLFIPAELAYGDKGAGDKIKPGSALIFEVELLDIITDKK